MTNGSDATWVAIGVVGRTHGRDGAFVVERPSESSQLFQDGATLYVGGTPARVVATRRAGRRLVIKLDVEVERGTELRLPRSELPRLEEGEYYVSDLVGLEAVSETGAPLGSIVDVLPLPANDVLELDSGELLPLVKACVLTVDVESGRVVIARSFAPGG